jgi:hypothetical protein
MKNLILLLALIVQPHFLHAQLDSWDSDQDAMPNGWEYHRDLNIEDPRDAWEDPDGNGICNLFEYFLGAHPQRPEQPRILQYTGEGSLEDFIRNAPRGSVIRIPEGEYQLNYLYETFSPAPRLMIQGGWNADFTEQDYCKYPTVLDGGKKGAIFEFLIASENSAALILDGLTLKNATKGAVSFISYMPKAQLMLANCTFINNEASRFSAIVRFEEGDNTLLSDFIMVNTTVAENKGTGVRVLQHANWTNCKILHSLIALNDYSENDGGTLSSGYGFSYQPASDSLLHIQLSNSILWDNANADVLLDDPDKKAVEVDSRYNLYGNIERDSTSSPFFTKFDRSQDPLLVKDASGYFYLDQGSPALGTGVNIGFTDNENPDIGVLSCGGALSTSSEELLTDSYPIKVFPNPARDVVFVETFFPKGRTCAVELFNVYGQLVKSVIFENRQVGKQVFRLSLEGLRAGFYFLQVEQGGRSLLILKK